MATLYHSQSISRTHIVSLYLSLSLSSFLARVRVLSLSLSRSRAIVLSLKMYRTTSNPINLSLSCFRARARARARFLLLKMYALSLAQNVLNNFDPLSLLLALSRSLRSVNTLAMSHVIRVVVVSHTSCRIRENLHRKTSIYE